MWRRVIFSYALISACLSLQPSPTLQLPPQNVTSIAPILESTNTPGKWPSIPATIDVEDYNLYIKILDYGLIVDPYIKFDIISNIVMIIVAIEHSGVPEQPPSAAQWTNGFVTFQYPHQRASNRLSRRELSLVLHTLCSLTILDGSRGIQTAYFTRGPLYMGNFCLTIHLPQISIHDG